MNYYIGIDIGGTKIAGAVVSERGKIISRVKIPSPAKANPKSIFSCLVDVIDEIKINSKLSLSQIQGIGLGVPGIVDTRKNYILAAPNVNLTGFPLSVELKKKYRKKVAMLNDVNAGLLGEAWLGSAQGFNNVVGVFPGTGVGGAAIIDGRMLFGTQGAATELGHMILKVGGPLCHCGNHGCLEALASRWAIERDIRELIKKGQKSIIKDLNKGNLATIKSRLLKEALENKDQVVTQVLNNVSVVLGQACVSLNHVFNPQAIVLGGGVIKACGFFILPVIQKAIKADPFFKKFNSCQILQSTLGDDAVILGAVKVVKES